MAEPNNPSESTPIINVEQIANLAKEVELRKQALELAKNAKTIAERVTLETQAQIKFEQEVNKIIGERKLLTDAIKELEDEADRLKKKGAEKNKEAIGAIKDTIEQHKKDLEEIGKIVKLTEQQLDVQKKINIELEKARKEGLEFSKNLNLKSLIEQLKKVEEGLRSDDEAVKRHSQAFLEGFSKIQAALTLATQGVEKLGKALIGGFNIPLLGTQIKGAMENVKEVLEAPAEAFKKYGFFQQKFQTDIDGMRSSVAKLGVAEKDLVGAFGAINSVFVDFDKENQRFRESLQKDVSLISLLGVEQGKFVKSVKDSSIAFNMQKDVARRTQTEILALSLTMQQGTKGLDDFIALTPKLAAFGEKGPQIFKDTAAAAKILGIETQKLHEVMSQYDSFEKAADAAGELNLALGGQFINSLELMDASIEKGPVETLKVLRKGMQESGKDLNSLSAAQIRYFADAAKVDVETFKKLFQGDPAAFERQIKDMEEQAKKQEDLNKIAKETQNVFQEIQNAFAAVFKDKDTMDSLKTFITGIASIAKAMSGLMSIVIKFAPLLASLWLIGKGAQFLVFLGNVQKAMVALNLITLRNTAAKAQEAAATATATTVTEADATANATNAAAKATSLAMNPAGWAVLAAGLALGAGAVATIMGMFPNNSSDVNAGGGGVSAPDIPKGEPQKAQIVGLPSSQTPVMGNDMSGQVPGGSKIVTPSGQEYRTNPNDNVKFGAAMNDGSSAEQIKLLREIANNIANPPTVVVQVDKKEIARAAREGSKTPFNLVG